MDGDPANPIVESSTLIELLRRRALQQPEHRAYTYLLDGEIEAAHLTYAALDCQARAIGAWLQSYNASGKRALLLYPSGLEFIAAFFGCLYAGVIAVPLPPPNPAQPQRTLPRLLAITNDAGPSLALTTSSIHSKMERLFAHAPELQAMPWLVTDNVTSSPAHEWQDPTASSASLALLQYTSGSTAVPKGVMVSHGNLLHNSAYLTHALELTPDSVSVTWLPAFHDMGLSNGIIQPLYTGGRCFLMPPQSFLQWPVRWLQAISRYEATVSGGPNFAYELCVRRITPEQRETLDLSSWVAAYDGAEPVRADTLKRFAGSFAPCGFRPRYSYPCYGLAEATLIVSGGLLRDEPIFCTPQVASLEKNHVVEALEEQNVRTFVGCGRAQLNTEIVIVHPDTLTRCAPDEVGEIWVSSPSVAQGYWNRPEETERTFRAYLADTGEGPFLRTEDLGFLKDGELFVTGRLKDLIIIGGRNLYPHDIELTVEQSHPAIRPGCCAAFSVDVADEERLIVIAEVERRYQPADRCPQDGEAHSFPKVRPLLDVEVVVRSIRRAVAEEHDVRVYRVALLRAGRIPKTPSGKVQRRVCQASFLDGTLERFGEE